MKLRWALFSSLICLMENVTSSENDSANGVSCPRQRGKCASASEVSPDTFLLSETPMLTAEECFKWCSVGMFVPSLFSACEYDDTPNGPLCKLVNGPLGEVSSDSVCWVFSDCLTNLPLWDRLSEAGPSDIRNLNLDDLRLSVQQRDRQQNLRKLSPLAEDNSSLESSFPIKCEGEEWNGLDEFAMVDRIGDAVEMLEACSVLNDRSACFDKGCEWVPTQQTRRFLCPKNRMDVSRLPKFSCYFNLSGMCLVQENDGCSYCWGSNCDFSQLSEGEIESSEEGIELGIINEEGNPEAVLAAENDESGDGVIDKIRDRTLDRINGDSSSDDENKRGVLLKKVLSDSLEDSEDLAEAEEVKKTKKLVSMQRLAIIYLVMVIGICCIFFCCWWFGMPAKPIIDVFRTCCVDLSKAVQGKPNDAQRTVYYQDMIDNNTEMIFEKKGENVWRDPLGKYQENIFKHTHSLLTNPDNDNMHSHLLVKGELSQMTNPNIRAVPGETSREGIRSGSMAIPMETIAFTKQPSDFVTHPTRSEAESVPPRMSDTGRSSWIVPTKSDNFQMDYSGSDNSDNEGGSSGDLSDPQKSDDSDVQIPTRRIPLPSDVQFAPVREMSTNISDKTESQTRLKSKLRHGSKVRHGSVVKISNLFEDKPTPTSKPDHKSLKSNPHLNPNSKAGMMVMPDVSPRGSPRPPEPQPSPDYEYDDDDHVSGGSGYVELDTTASGMAAHTTSLGMIDANSNELPNLFVPPSNIDSKSTLL